MITEIWNVKDIVNHLINWNFEAGKELKRCWGTKMTPWFLNTSEYESFNQKFTLKHRFDSPTVILHNFVDSEKYFNQVVDNIEENNIRKYIDQYYWVFDEGDNNHYLEHLVQIKKALKK